MKDLEKTTGINQYDLVSVHRRLYKIAENTYF